MDFKHFAILSLAAYRLADLIAWDDGPLFIFKRFREWTGAKALDEAKANIELGKWQSLNEGINCPYCVGLWLAFILVLIPKRYSVLLYPLAIAGAQSWLEGTKK